LDANVSFDFSFLVERWKIKILTKIAKKAIFARLQ
jgi:hypothetical protein